MSSLQLEDACRNIHADRKIRAPSDKPHFKRGVYLTHDKLMSSSKHRAEFTIAYIRHDKFSVPNINDISTRPLKRLIATSRSFENTEKMLRTLCSNRHGAPIAFNADSNICIKHLVALLNGHNNEERPQPSGSTHKKWKNVNSEGLFKHVLKKSFK